MQTTPRKRSNLPFYEDVEVLSAGIEGASIAKVGDLVVFVTDVVPGDIVDIQVIRKRKNFVEAIPINYKHYSDLRVKPYCEHFGVCGSCKWQNIAYEKQLEFKQQQVIDTFERIGHIDLNEGVVIPEVMPIVPSPLKLYYRNKLEFTFSNSRWLYGFERENIDEPKNMNALGFHIIKRFDKVFDVQNCYLQREPSNTIRNALKEFAIKNRLDFYDLRNKDGFLRHLYVRTSSTGETMIIVSFNREDWPKQELVLNFLYKSFPEVTSLMYVINPNVHDGITNLLVKRYKGRDHIFEQMENLKFKIGPRSFYQPNASQAYNLYKIVREYAGLTGNEIVYDLYTGTGTIANFVASACKKVIGIEYVYEAIENARENSEINNIENTEFFAGDMRSVLDKYFFDDHGMPDVIILDPPRAGLHTDVVGSILYAQPKRIVYVSCNPATQARDINLLLDSYNVTKIQPVDMFPQTHHVENVTLLERKY